MVETKPNNKEDRGRKPDAGRDGQAQPADYLRQRNADGAECLAAALDGLSLGWSMLAICPPDHVGVGREHGKGCQSPGKAPWGPWKAFQETLPTAEQLETKWRHNPTLNVGMALGPVSGLVRVDVDGEQGERRLLEISDGDLPDTLEFSSGGGGRGLLYRIPSGINVRTTHEQQGGKKQEIRFQAKGAQTVLPPSRHVSGRRYEWEPGHGPDDIEPALMPAWLIRELTPSNGEGGHRPAQGRHDGRTVTEGGRNNALASLAGSMRRRGMGEDAILAALLVENERLCDPPLAEEEVRNIARSVASYPPEDSITGEDNRQTGRQIIRDYFRQKYEPKHRNETAIYSETLRRDVTPAEACLGLSEDLQELLIKATDVPRWGDSKAVKTGSLPKFFTTWGRAAWADMLDGLSEEEDAEEISASAEERFINQMRSALREQITLLVRPREGEKERQEHRSLLDWCVLLGKPGRWAGIRSYCLWTCKSEDGAVRISMNAELFTQIRRSDLKMSQCKFTKLAERYSLGARVKACGTRAIELNQAFLEGERQNPANAQTFADSSVDSSLFPENFSSGEKVSTKESTDKKGGI